MSILARSIQLRWLASDIAKMPSSHSISRSALRAPASGCPILEPEMTKTLIPGLLLCFLSFAAFPATMPPVRGKIVDAQDGRPLGGAHVLFQGSATEGTLTGHGGRHANLFAVETVTDESGEFHFPQQEFSARPFFLNTNYHNPTMVVLKPGYALVVLTNTLRIIPDLDEITTWQYDKQTIRMKPVATDADTDHAVYFAKQYAELTTSEKNFCYWKKIPRFLVATDRLAVEWERKRATLADPALRNRVITSPLQQILMNEQRFIENACGSPRAYFEPYLR